MDDTLARYVEEANEERDVIVRSLARRFGHDAEEHVAEAYARCCAARVRDRDHAVRWVSLTAAHLAIDATRAHAVAHRHARELVGPASEKSAEDRYLERELHDRLAQAVAALPPDRRDIIRAWAEGSASSEIALRVGRSVYAVKHVVARTLTQLREQLRDAELALIAFGLRRRRGTRNRAAGSYAAVTAALPAFAIALSLGASIATAAFSELLWNAKAQVPSHEAGRTPSAPLSASAVAEASAGTTTLSSLPAEGRSGSRSVFPEEISETKARIGRGVFGSLPGSVEVKAGGDARAGKRRDGSPQYEPDDDDPASDLAYCLTHPVVTPTQISCDQPGQ